MTPKQKMVVVVPIVAALVIAFIYFGFFTNPYVILGVFLAWLAVTVWNRRKFGGRKKAAALGSS